MTATETLARPPRTANGGPPVLALVQRLRDCMNAELRGKSETVELVLACLLARGHLLLEDLPGLGKTTLAKTLAQGVGGRFSRVQCTPDLLPGDITGFSVFNQQTREFEFQAGPVFADILLVDEINRATPRTQSALLEAMAEGQATVDNVRHSLSPTLLVVATQNPVEHHGTYPLPEAQLDRFAMKVSIGYPDAEHERQMLARAVHGATARCDGESPPCAQTELRRLQDETAALTVSPSIHDYLVRLAGASRGHRRVDLGVSPRGLLVWQRVAQAWALLQGRSFVTPDDVQEVALPVLRVRLGGDFVSADAVGEEILRQVSVPTA